MVIRKKGIFSFLILNIFLNNFKIPTCNGGSLTQHLSSKHGLEIQTETQALDGLKYIGCYDAWRENDGAVNIAQFFLEANLTTCFSYCKLKEVRFNQVVSLKTRTDRSKLAKLYQ